MKLNLLSAFGGNSCNQAEMLSIPASPRVGSAYSFFQRAVKVYSLRNLKGDGFINSLSHSELTHKHSNGHFQCLAN